MSAIVMTLLAYLRHNVHIIFTKDCYRQTRDFATNILTGFGMQVSIVEPTAREIARAIRPNTTVIFTESPTNPYLRVLDIPAIVKVARQRKVKTIIDATLATPYNIQPLAMGVDIVIHSATKYLGGHNDLLAGVALGKNKMLDDLYRMQRMIGATPGPFTCFLLERGLKTFALRMEQHNRAGLAIARLLESHPKIEKVWYPGLTSHPDYKIAREQMRGFGSVITFLVKGGEASAVAKVWSPRWPRCRSSTTLKPTGAPSGWWTISSASPSASKTRTTSSPISSRRWEKSDPGHKRSGRLATALKKV